MRLNEELPLKEMIEVEFAVQGHAFRLAALVDYRCHENCYGLKFHFSSEEERTSFESLLGSVHKSK